MAKDPALDETLKFLVFAHRKESLYNGGVTFNLTYPDGSKALRVVLASDEGVQLLSDEEPASGVTCRCHMTRDTFLNCYSGALHPRTAILSGQVRVEKLAFREMGKFCSAFDFSSQKWIDFYTATGTSPAIATPRPPAPAPSLSPAMTVSTVVPSAESASFMSTLLGYLSISSIVSWFSSSSASQDGALPSSSYPRSSAITFSPNLFSNLARADDVELRKAYTLPAGILAPHNLRFAHSRWKENTRLLAFAEDEPTSADGGEPKRSEDDDDLLPPLMPPTLETPRVVRSRVRTLMLSAISKAKETDEHGLLEEFRETKRRAEHVRGSLLRVMGKAAYVMGDRMDQAVDVARVLLNGGKGYRASKTRQQERHTLESQQRQGEGSGAWRAHPSSLSSVHVPDDSTQQWAVALDKLSYEDADYWQQF